jgi:uncharacterized protein (DUF2147 family)
MKHHAFAAAMGLLIAAALIPTSQSQAASADPTGIWRKADQGERPGKMELFWCGTSKKLLCAKIVWLQNPLDSRGRPLHDIRNENPSMRDRPILGLPIFNGLTPTGPATWNGKIYNPEDGNTYSATLTLVSRNQINLKGCKAWLLCGERAWVRTTLPAAPKPEPEPQIEASAEPEAAVQPASAEETKPEPTPQEKALAEAEMLTPVVEVEHDTSPGYRYLKASASAEPPASLSGENVPSMFVMTKPIASEANASSSGEAPADRAALPQEAASAPRTQAAAVEPQAKPKPRALQATAAATPQPRPAPAAPAAQGAVPADEEIQGLAAGEAETAETAVLEEPPLTRRQRRLLRRQQQQEGLLPWLR